MGDKKIFIFVSLICLIGLASAWADNSSSYQEVDGCNLLNTTGATYVLTGNVTSTATCFTINAQNITLDCAGNWITYSTAGAINTRGIYTTQFNSTIKNCNILDGNWGSSQTTRYGIYFNTNDYSTLFNNLVNTSKSPAVYLYNNANYNNLTLNTIIANSTSALALSTSSNNILENINAISTTATGIYLDNSVNNTLININATSNTNYGLYLQFVSNSTLLNVNSTSVISEKDLYFMPNSVYDCNNTFTNVKDPEGKSIIYLTGTSSNIDSLDSSSLILCNANFSNITNSNFTRGGIRLFYSHQNTLSNILANYNQESAIQIYSSSKNNNLSNITSSSNTSYGMNIGASYNTLTNINSTSNTNYGILISGSNNIFHNINSSSNTQLGLYLQSASNNILNSIILSSNNGHGLRIFSGSNNTLSNVNSTSNTQYGIQLSSTLNNNLSNITAISGNETIIRLDSNSDSNSIINSTFISLYKNKTLLYLASDCNSNRIYWNNFTETSGYYVQDWNGSNYYNTTINGTYEGNIWHDIMNGSVNISGKVNSSVYSSFYIGRYGTDYPYKNTTSFGKLSGNVVDYAPLTTLFGEDYTSPTYGFVSSNSSYANKITKFSIIINDNDVIHTNGQYVFSTNNSGEWVNDTAVNFSSTPEWANVSKILNSTGEMTIGYMWYFSDNLGNLNSTFIYTLTTIPQFSGLGNGTIENPYNITSCTQLQEMENYLSSYFQLVNNINCSDTINWNSGLGFEPVGKNETYGFYFNGNFNGNNFNITDLVINRSSSDYVGLFGYASSVSIKDVGFIEANIIGKDYVGILIGFTQGFSQSILNSYSIGNVNGNDYVGGLVGYQSSGITIKNSYATGNVSGNNRVGGLVGYSSWEDFFSSVAINNSYATGNVSGNTEVGGLVGCLHGNSIVDSYSTGNVNGSSNVGGFVGNSIDSGTINNSYSIGNVTSLGNYTGGLVGNQISGYILNSYSIGNVTSLGNYTGGLVGHSNSEGMSSTSINNSHTTGNVTGNNYIGGLVGYANLQTTIFSSYSTTNVLGEGDYVGGIVGSQYYSEIIESYSTGNVYGRDYVGGITGSSTEWSRSILEKSYSTGNVYGRDYVGGIIGYTDGFMMNIEMKNSYSTGIVSGNFSVGGFIGKTGGWTNIDDSYSTGNVSGNSSVGGFIGYRGSGYTTKSYSTGNVSGNTEVGGFIGYKEPSWTNLYNCYWYNQSQELDCYSGGNQNCTAIYDLNYFYDYENVPMNLTSGNGWDFVSVWDNVYNGTYYPVLQFQGIDIIYPNITFVSPTTATGENIQTFITANVSVENATSVVNLTVFLYNSSSGNLIVQNSTTSNNLFWNITGLSVGNYSLNASVEDNDGLINQTETLSINLTVFLDTFSPTYSSVAHSSTYAGHVASFSININDETALHTNGQYIFSTNNSGEWINDTAVNFTSTPSWANVSKTLNSTVGTVVGYMWYLNDDNGNVNSTSVYKLTTTQAPVVDPPSSGGGGGGSAAQVQTQYQLGREFSEQGESLKLRKNYQVGFRHQEESHTLTLNSFTTNTARVTIQSDPITATLEKDVTQGFDLDGEEGNDFEITYQGTSGSEAQFFVKKLVLVSGESEVFVNSEGGEVQETQTNQISTNELFGTSGSGSESVDVAREKTKRAKNPLRTVLISLIIMGAVIAGLYAIGKNEKKKKDHYLGFFDK